MKRFNLKAIGRNMMGVCCFCLYTVIAPAAEPFTDTLSISQQYAIRFIDSCAGLRASASWPAINPKQFLQNIRQNITEPLALYEGTSTNFCGYAALSYLLLHDDPLQYARFMIQLYSSGKADWRKISFAPSAAVRKAAGTLRFKGSLDIHPAEQMWLLSLADHFKGYLNVFNRHFDRGDENTFWAAVNYSKFNRMVRIMSGYDVVARGSDLMRPWIFDLYGYILERFQTGITVLYLNNTLLHKKNHNRIRTSIPTHYVILLDIKKNPSGMISIIYWDYGFRTLREVSPSFFKKIVFGISHCTKKHE